MESAILFVDDDPTDVSIMTHAFDAAQFRAPLRTVNGGEEAIAYLKGKGHFADRVKYPLPSLVLLDLKTRDPDGFDVLRWIRNQSSLKRLRVIILSVSALSSDVERAFDEGVTSFLVKPDSLAGMIDMLCCLRDWVEYNRFPAIQDEKESFQGALISTAEIPR